MVRANFKPVTPDQPIRDLRKDRKALDKEEPGAERAARLAAFVRTAHDLRELNMAMHAAAECLAEDPDAPDLLIQAYDLAADDEDTETRLRLLTDLQDLARYLERDDIREHATTRIDEIATAWIRDAGDDERARLRTLTNIFDRAYADGISDKLRFG